MEQADSSRMAELGLHHKIGGGGAFLPQALSSSHIMARAGNRVDLGSSKAGICCGGGEHY